MTDYSQSALDKLSKVIPGFPTAKAGEEIVVEVGSCWTVSDQDFRDGLNYWHVRDEDLIVVVIASLNDGVVVKQVKSGKDLKPLTQAEFREKYRPLDEREAKLIQQMADDAALTGVEFNGPWTITICKGCGMMIDSFNFSHFCSDGRRIHKERAEIIKVVRQK